MTDDVYRAEIQTLTRQVGLLAELIHQAVPCRYCPARSATCTHHGSPLTGTDCKAMVVRWSRDRAEKGGE
jgi:hypothetical protein